MLRHTNDGKPEGTGFCFLKSGSGVTQIQRHLNRDDFDVSQMTTHYVIKQKRKTKKNAISSKEKHVVCRRYSKANPDVVKRSGL